MSSGPSRMVKEKKRWLLSETYFVSICQLMGFRHNLYCGMQQVTPEIINRKRPFNKIAAIFKPRQGGLESATSVMF